MTNPTPVTERTWTSEEALTMACAIFRTKGFTSTSSMAFAQEGVQRVWTSKEHLSYQLVPEIASPEYKELINVKQEDADAAADIIRHYRKLTFGVIADDLGDYMTRVFSSTQNEQVTFKDLGVIASVPSAYQKDMESARLKKESKNSVQEHIGVVGDSIELTIRYINTGFVQKLECYAHDAITNSGHMVNFLNKKKLGEVGQVQQIRAKVKSHGANYQTKALQTQLNYVKVIDIEFVWQ
jgi:hypothetical protein